MPLIGYLILFNSVISEWIKPILPIEKSSQEPDFLQSLFDQNLVFLYFGLLLFGVGVSVFNFSAPGEIRRYPAIEDYISSVVTISTPNLTISTFLSIVDEFCRNLSEEEQSAFYSSDHIAFPKELSAGLHRVVGVGFQSEFKAENHDLDWHATFGDRFYSGTGDLLTEKVIDLLNSSIRADRAITEPLVSNIATREKDVFFLQHVMLEHSKPMQRFMVFAFYILGIVLMAIPTILTATLILRNWI